MRPLDPKKLDITLSWDTTWFVEELEKSLVPVLEPLLGGLTEEYRETIAERLYTTLCLHQTRNEELDRQLQLAVLASNILWHIPVQDLDNLDTRSRYATLGITFYGHVKAKLQNPLYPFAGQTPSPKFQFFLVSAKYQKIQDWHEGISEDRFRTPLDALVDLVWEAEIFQMNVTGHYDRYTRTVPSKALTGPGCYCKAHIYLVQVVKHGLTGLTADKCELLLWGKESLMEVACLAGEFNPEKFRATVNQVVTDIISGATINELLGIPYPVFGVAVTRLQSAVFVCRAQADSNGQMTYAVRKLSEWGPLTEFQNFLQYVSFLFAHKHWYKEKVVAYIKTQSGKDPEWVIKALGRRHFKPWTEAKGRGE
ncbi:hypothetical protein K435DRAFT_780316 [Dendrothele bispora CBS 962.96]|uniref:Uncharacterized protein n=1 Tax=Dendrothele bispora (strain CBS 962.96) TaxID=1314807 RepID=A0A4S8LS54_DENBC|nr:hypothetical protein K435DRAFT_780316 [Dendrothele bispora CBS 962.96]